MKSTRLFREFFNSEKAGGLVLIACTVISLLIANASSGADYVHFWHRELAGLSIGHWINDLLMTIFFLLIGLELEREIYIGELSNLKSALLPVFAAIGGMIVPAAFYLALNAGEPTQSGAGIPMATDIAFALGVLSLLGRRVPFAMKIFLTALAVIDDLGAILVIAFFYSGEVLWINLSVALGIFAVLLALNRLRVMHLLPYLAGGAVMWYYMHASGVHATITGVLLAFAIPFGRGDARSISYRLQQVLHKPVAFVILPLFALANTAIVLPSGFGQVLTESYSLGIALGLIIGKPLGIFTLTFLTVKLGIGRLGTGLDWKRILGLGFLGGIGFTMSIFIALLSFDDAAVTDNAKLMILLSSLAAGGIGFAILKVVLRR